MKLGYSSMTAGIYDLDEAFRLACDLSLDFVELTYDVCDFLPDAQPVCKVKELVRATGVTVSVHLPFIDLNIASLISEARRAAVEQTRRGLEYAAAVNAECGVLHTGTVFVYQPRPLSDAQDALLTSLDELPKVGVPLALENLGLYVDGLIREPQMLLELTQQAGGCKNGVYNCLDFGHAHIEASRPWRTAPASDPVQGYIDTLGESIVHLHLCNNNGSDDLHTATSEGTLRYEAYRDYLSNFEGTVCLEVAGGRGSVQKSAQHIRSLVQQTVLSADQGRDKSLYRSATDAH